MGGPASRWPAKQQRRRPRRRAPSWRVQPTRARGTRAQDRGAGRDGKSRAFGRRAVLLRRRVVPAADARRPAEADRRKDVDYIIVDALDESSVSAVGSAWRRRLQAVVNLIGGYAPPKPLPELDVGVLRQQFELNLMTAAIVTKHAMPLLAAPRRRDDRARLQPGRHREGRERVRLQREQARGGAADRGGGRRGPRARECGSTALCRASSTRPPTGRRCPTPNTTGGPSRLSWPPSWPFSSPTMPPSSPGAAIPVYGLPSPRAGGHGRRRAATPATGTGNGPTVARRAELGGLE